MDGAVVRERSSMHEGERVALAGTERSGIESVIVFRRRRVAVVVVRGIVVRPGHLVAHVDRERAGTEHVAGDGDGLRRCPKGR